MLLFCFAANMHIIIDMFPSFAPVLIVVEKDTHWNMISFEVSAHPNDAGCESQDWCAYGSSATFRP